MCIDPSAPRSHGFNKHSQVLLSLGWETVQLHWNPIRASLLRHQSIATYCQPFLAASSPRAHALSSLSPLSEFPTSISLKHFLSVGKDPKKIKREITCACVIALRKRKNEKAHMLCPISSGINLQGMTSTFPLKLHERSCLLTPLWTPHQLPLNMFVYFVLAEKIG